MMTETRIGEMKRKIAALLAKAGSTEHAAEAETFLAKAHELMERYQLDHADVVLGDDPIVHFEGRDFTTGDFSWKRELYSALARLYGCRPVSCSGGHYSNGRWSKTTIKAVGRESATVTLELMYPFVAAQVREAGYRLSRETRKSAGSSMNSVGMALVLRISRMIAEQERQQERAETPEARNALVVMDQVEAKLGEFYPSLRSRKGRSIGVSGRAREAAAGIGLDRQVGGAGQLKLGRS